MFRRKLRLCLSENWLVERIMNVRTRHSEARPEALC